jgi:hypothetical protein
MTTGDQAAAVRLKGDAIALATSGASSPATREAGLGGCYRCQRFHTPVAAAAAA